MVAKIRWILMTSSMYSQCSYPMMVWSRVFSQYSARSSELSFDPNCIDQKKLNKIVKHLKISPKSINQDVTQALSKKIQLLESIGCSERAMCHDPVCHHILNLEESEIVNRITTLKKFGIDTITVELLKFAAYSKDYRNKKLARISQLEVSTSEVAHDRETIKEAYICHKAMRNSENLEHLGLKLNSKLSFLFSKGFKSRDIYNSLYILEHSLPVLKRAYKEISDNHIEQITLSNMQSYIRVKKIQRYGSRRINIAKLFNWNLDEIEISEENFKALALQEKLYLKRNYHFLKDEGFPDDILCKLPLVLGHHPDVLKRNWEMLKTGEKLHLWKKGDQVKTLNLLQYYIEKETNFKHPVVYFDEVSKV